MDIFNNTGPCAKVRVFCTLVHPDGQRWVGENVVRKPQVTCPRGNMPSGMGYNLCINVCNQIGHAEVVACMLAGNDAAGSTAYIEGRDYICLDCQKRLREYGVVKWVLGAPPKVTILSRMWRWLTKPAAPETEEQWKTRQQW